MAQPRPGYAFRGPVPQGALDYLRGKDLRPGFSYQDVWGEEHASAFTVAKAMQLDILDDIRGALDSALAKGQTFQQFKKDLAPVLQKKGWWGTKEAVDPKTGESVTARLGSPRRLRTIFDANTRAAYAAGQWDRIQRTKDALPYLLYQLGPSLHHRPEHVAWSGTLLRADDPWWETHMPPNGWGCKCWVRQVGPSEHARLSGREGTRTEAPAEHPREWVNKRTGVVETVDQGLDPAWARNPGKDRQALLRTALTDKTAAAGTALARASVRQVMASPILDEWLKDGQGEIPGGVVDKEVQGKLDAKTQVVRLSKATMDKQAGRHPELDADAYRQILPEVLERGMVIADRDRNLVFLLDRNGKVWKAAVKTDEQRGKLYLTTLHMADASEVRRMMKRGALIRPQAEGESGAR
ncbi:MAG: phage minor head protein [Acidobacteriota bacterium]